MSKEAVLMEKDELLKEYIRLRDEVGKLLVFFRHREGRRFLTDGRGTPHMTRRLIEKVEDLEKLVPQK